MKEKPIIFNADSVRAILNGTKTQTRRAIKPQPPKDFEPPQIGTVVWYRTPNQPPYIQVTHEPTTPYSVGQRLWVRETWANDPITGLVYRVTEEGAHRYPRPRTWKSPIYMPRVASRITLEVLNIRPERLNDITDEDAVAEGMHPQPTNCEMCRWGVCSIHQHPNDRFIHLWDSINACRGYPWDSNPWVWRIEFRRVES